MSRALLCFDDITPDQVEALHAAGRVIERELGITLSYTDIILDNTSKEKAPEISPEGLLLGNVPVVAMYNDNEPSASQY